MSSSPHKRERSITPSSPSSTSLAASKRDRSQTPNPSSPVTSRKRERSRTPSSPGSDRDEASTKRLRSELSVEVCREFLRNGCKRSEIDCKYAHPHPTASIVSDKVIACMDSLRNKCHRGRTCRYYHPPPHIQESLLRAIGEESKVETVCKDFLRGRCLRSAKNCRFAHQTPIDHCAVVCQDFMRGNCERKSCRFSHVLVAEKPEICQEFLRGKCEHRPCRYSHFVVPETPQVCQDFLRGKCERRTCKYTHILPEISQGHFQPYPRLYEQPHSTPRTGTEQESLQVCRDFLKKMCNRNPCKYAHPDSQTKVVNDQVEVCRDFCRGVCRRTVCRFYHPSTVKDTK